MAHGPWLALLLAAAFSQPSEHHALGTPQVWIFSGHPGDREHDELFHQRVNRLLSILNENYGVPTQDCRVLVGEECRAEPLHAAIGDASRALLAGAPVWMFFFGHANPTPRGANYNLVGPDVSSEELGRWMEPLKGPAPLVVFFTTSCGGTFLRPLAGPGHVLVTATQPRREINETLFPDALLDALEARESDADGDGKTSVLELFRAILPRVAQRFSEQELAQTEHALLDGNGDGNGSSEPASAEIPEASRIALTWRGNSRGGTSSR